MSKPVEIKMMSLPMSIIVDDTPVEYQSPTHPRYLVDGLSVPEEVFATYLLMRQADIAFATHKRMLELLERIPAKAVPPVAPEAGPSEPKAP